MMFCARRTPFTCEVRALCACVCVCVCVYVCVCVCESYLRYFSNAASVAVANGGTLGSVVLMYL
jgi:hypothetical protein